MGIISSFLNARIKFFKTRLSFIAFLLVFALLLLSLANAGDVVVENGKLDVSTKLYVDSTGNVGIGTITPTQKLDVIGTIQTAGFKLTTSPAAGYVLTSDASGAGTWQPLNSLSSGWTDDGFVVRLTTATDKVGIGTLTPANKLHVKESSANSIIVVDSGDGTTGRWSSVDFYDNNIPKWGAGKNNIGNFYIDQSSVGNALTILSSNRNVGIGTTAPNYLLQVGSGTDGRGANLSNVLYVNATNQSVGIGLMNQSEKLAVAGTIQSLSGGFKFPDGSVQTTAAFNSNSISGSSVWNSSGAKVYLNDSLASVGIGAFNPTSKLTLAGTLNMTKNRITDVAVPIDSSDAATKGYVDAASGLTFAGYTALTTGNLGGLKGANSKCSTAFPGSHWASYDEIMRLGPNYPWTTSVWARDAINGIAVVSGFGTNYYYSLKDGTIYQTQSSNIDCSGWTSSSPYPSMGTVIDTSGTVTTAACSYYDIDIGQYLGSSALACVK